MLPMVIAAAHDKPLLGPDDLRADAETLAYQALCDGRGVKGAVPDIGDVAWKQGPGGSRMVKKLKPSQRWQLSKLPR